MLYLTTPNFEAYLSVLRTYPKAQRLELITEADQKGQTVLHYLIEEPSSLHSILYLLSEKDRKVAITYEDKNGTSPISASLPHEKSFEVLLYSLSQSDQLEMLSIYLYNMPTNTMTQKGNNPALKEESEEYGARFAP